MLSDELKNKLGNTVGGEVRFDEPLANHSTMKVGGVASAFVVPKSVEELISALRMFKEENIDVFILGAGSNVLFRDGGFDGAVVSTAGLAGFSVRNNDEGSIVVNAGAGVPINDLVLFSIGEGVYGFEYLSGIPGTVGGALTMNAGTHDGTISDPLVAVSAVDRSGRLYQWSKDKIEFSYRKAKYPKSCVIVSAEFLLQRGVRKDIEKRAGNLRERRRARHPLSWPSLGSIFKNPQKGPGAGELIEEAGLKGVRVGGARIAVEHGNWIINEGGASSKDIEVLIHLIREKVKEASDVSLETEIVIIGCK